MYKKAMKFILILSPLLLFFLWFISDDELYGSSSTIVSQYQSVNTKDNALAVETIFRGIEFPTSMAFLNKDQILVLEKNNGTVKIITQGKMSTEPVIDLEVASRGERGLLGIATLTINSENKNKTLVFLYLTESSGKDGDDVDNKKNPIGNRLYRFEFSENTSKLLNKKLLIDLPVGEATHHNGGKIVIGPDGNVYFTVGDLGNDNFQVTNKIKGSKPDGRAGILRITSNGEPVEDDFTLSKQHPLNKYFAYGIRNSFGIDFDPVGGKLWDIENGPGFGDEINLVEPGFNSGWSKVQSYWANTTTTSPIFVGESPYDLVSFDGKGKYSSPELSFLNKTGLSAIQFFDSGKLGKKYKDTVFVGDFHSGKLYNFRLSDNRSSLILDTNSIKYKMVENARQLEQFVFAEGFGGIVDVQTGPDGYLYILSLKYGGDDCYKSQVNCIDYSSKNIGTIFRIVPK